MDLKEIVDLQRAFDAAHSGEFPWDRQVADDPQQMLSFLLVAIVGELGELSNIVKKVLRGDEPFEAVKGHVSAELADIFIYLLKFADQSGIDLEEAFLEKLEMNRLRFQQFEKRPGTL